APGTDKIESQLELTLALPCRVTVAERDGDLFAIGDTVRDADVAGKRAQDADAATRYHEFDRQRDRRRGRAAGAFESHVRAFSIGRVGDLLDRIVPAVQDDPVRRSYCESRRQYPLVPADENRRRAVVSDDLAQGEAKSARSDDKRSHPGRHGDAVQRVNR